jgi:entry exclusion lipoprotein TrbK
LVFTVVIALFAAGPAPAQAPAQDNTSCEAKAIDKNGKPMQGAVKQTFLKKCKQEACLPKAVDKNGKPLRGAVKDTFMKKCEAEA